MKTRRQVFRHIQFLFFLIFFISFSFAINAEQHEPISELDQILALNEKSDTLHRDIGKLLYAIAEEAKLEIIRKGNQFEDDL